MWEQLGKGQREGKLGFAKALRHVSVIEGKKTVKGRTIKLMLRGRRGPSREEG